MANIKKLVIDRANHAIALISDSKTFHPPIFIHESDLENYKVNGLVTSVIKLPTA
jgi:hypothetical protein